MVEHLEDMGSTYLFFFMHQKPGNMAFSQLTTLNFLKI